MNKFEVISIGNVKSKNGETRIEVEAAYRPALAGLTGFRYLQALWWFDGCDNKISRNKLVEHKPYTHGPDTLGTFATRSPERPNPIALSTVYVTNLDIENGIIHVAYLDAFDGTPILDLKPYTPSLDRVEHPIVPDWCAHWPTCNEKSGNYDWQHEFNF